MRERKKKRETGKGKREERGKQGRRKERAGDLRSCILKVGVNGLESLI